MKTEFDAFKQNINSQYGEDGILRELLARLGITGGLCMDIGAWDGKHYSNVWALIEKGYTALLLEGNPNRFKVLAENVKPFERKGQVVAACMMADEQTLASLFKQFPVKLRGTIPAVLNIDTDGDDVSLWRAVHEHLQFPVAVIEWNDKGNKKDALVIQTGEDLGMVPVAWTNSNIIFVEKSIAGAAHSPVLVAEVGLGGRL